MNKIICCFLKKEYKIYKLLEKKTHLKNTKTSKIAKRQLFITEDEFENIIFLIEI